MLAFAAPPSTCSRASARLAATGLRAAVVEAPEVREESSEEKILDELMEMAAAAGADGGFALRARVDAEFGLLTGQDIADLQMKPGNGEEAANAARALEGAISAAIEKRMAAAKDTIEELITCERGNVMAEIKKAMKRHDSPLPLLMVLQMNIDQAAQDGLVERQRTFMHISTVMNEELEKKAPRVQAMLNRLLRLDDSRIRENILRYNLEPKEVGGAPLDFDDDEPSAPLMAAQVPPQRLSAALAQTVESIDKQLRAIVGENDPQRFETLERVRQIAKEARDVIFDLYGQEEMDAFSNDLTPCFRILMSHRAKIGLDGVKPPEDEAESEAETADPATDAALAA